jgi:hypothetical protein
LTVFDDLEAAFEEMEWLVQRTGKTHLIKHHKRGKYKVVREYCTSDNGNILARMAKHKDFRDHLPVQLQKVIGRAVRNAA